MMIVFWRLRKTTKYNSWMQQVGIDKMYFKSWI